ncbi:MAG: hypothetical protein NTX29_15420 [Actinobacteria bacterium]|nr:hypothetical protein [Actinomycetota bacterium]
MSRTPLVDAWRRALATKRRPMQVPGHKMRYAEGAPGWAADLVGDTVGSDVPLQGGVDDNAFTNKYLEQAETLWAAAVGADHSRFLLGGSSQGNIAALGTVADIDVPIAIDRTSHRSTQAALVISGARPVWIYPRLHPDFHLPVGMEASSITDVTEDVNGFFATSPSYIGTISDVASLVTAARARKQPLIIDQAWGAHLDFLPGMGAMALGADISVTSVHKALLGYSSTAVVSTHDGLVVRTTLDRWVDLTTTTSPSGTLFATIDGTRAAMERDGQARLELIAERGLPRRSAQADAAAAGHRRRRSDPRGGPVRFGPWSRVGRSGHARLHRDGCGRAGVDRGVRGAAGGPDRVAPWRRATGLAAGGVAGRAGGRRHATSGVLLRSASRAACRRGR